VKNIFYAFLLLLKLNAVFAQSSIEYITNGSFEDIDTCLGFTSQPNQDYFLINGCKGWSNPLGQSTSDHYCYSSIWPNIPPYVPGVGYQFPRNGQCMAGISIGAGYTFNHLNYREYIQNKLQHPLLPNKRYRLQFFISDAGYSNCYFSQIGAKFFTQPVFFSNAENLVNIIPDTENEMHNFIYDTMTWKLVQMEYIANGGEEYVIIGCFKDSVNLKYSPNCDTSNINFWNQVGCVSPNNYYFIDDVSITEIVDNVEIPNVFSPNNDGVNDVFFINTNLKEWICIIYNRWGEPIHELRNDNNNWSNNNISEGTYFYLFQDKELNNISKGYLLITK
jgi:gliding motility-associated-like protein